MPSFFDKLRPKSHKHSSDQSQQQKQQEPPQPQPPQPEPPKEDPTFSIQPHPATSNDPQDLQPSQPSVPGGGLNSIPEQQPFNTPGPYIPSQELRDNIEQPKSREELKALSAELNK